MSYANTPVPPNWRCDPGLSSVIEYRKKFAWFPVVCEDGTKLWLKKYYKKYELWSHGGSKIFNDSEYLHTDYIESITEAEYIIRKLQEGF